MTSRALREQGFPGLAGVWRVARFGFAALAASAALMSSGCGEEEPAPPQEEQQSAPPPQPRFQWSDVSKDVRVQYAPGTAPSDTRLGEALASFASSLARGDAEAFRGHLTPTAGETLDALIASGDWDEQTAGIEAVRLTYVLDQGGSAEIGLAVRDGEGMYLLGWFAEDYGDAWRFSGIDVQQPPVESLEGYDTAPFRRRGN